MGGPGGGPQRKPWSPPETPRDWYQKERWRRIAKAQLRKEPLCHHCLEKGIVTPATIADHIVPHAGVWNAFILNELQSLCLRCHNRKHGDDARGWRSDVGDDGWPLDYRHPANRKK